MEVISTNLFFTDKCVGRAAPTAEYFQPLRWPTILLACTALRCALLDYATDGIKQSPVCPFERESFYGTIPEAHSLVLAITNRYADDYQRYEATYKKVREISTEVNVTNDENR